MGRPNKIEFAQYKRTEDESSILVRVNDGEPQKVTARPPVTENKMKKRITSNIK